MCRRRTARSRQSGWIRVDDGTTFREQQELDSQRGVEKRIRDEERMEQVNNCFNSEMPHSSKEELLKVRKGRAVESQKLHKVGEEVYWTIMWRRGQLDEFCRSPMLQSNSVFDFRLIASAFGRLHLVTAGGTTKASGTT